MKVFPYTLVVVGLMVQMLLGQVVCSANHVFAANDPASVIPTNCTNYPVTIQPEAGRWNIFGVARDVDSTADRNITLGSVSSALAGSPCDFLVANGHLGTTTGNSGTISRVSGTGNSLVRLGPNGIRTLVYNPVTDQLSDFDSYSWNVSSSTNGNPANATVVRAFEFEVFQPGDYSIRLTNSTNPNNDASYLDYAFFRPGTGPGWRP